LILQQTHPDVDHRPSLYDAFHSGNAETWTSQHLQVETVMHHQHRFHFTDAMHAARYLVTNPKYQLSGYNTPTLAKHLDTVLHGRGVSTDSTITYIVATPS
ncbi:hypothetical protein, partial [Sciscionella sediminilitoris]|uniref:hypothetical protein n=1 Tax=Sciscionella sediminilitoris TaxID=1445613 RepID=UPI0004DF0225